MPDKPSICLMGVSSSEFIILLLKTNAEYLWKHDVDSQEFHKNEDVGREREVSVREQKQVKITWVFALM